MFYSLLKAKARFRLTTKTSGSRHLSIPSSIYCMSLIKMVTGSKADAETIRRAVLGCWLTQCLGLGILKLRRETVKYRSLIDNVFTYHSRTLIYP